MSAKINNSFYDSLGVRWLNAQNDPVALLRAEGKLKQAWIIEKIKAENFNSSPLVLDIGCGAGFLSRELAKQNIKSIGCDFSLSTLKLANTQISEINITYQQADAYHLPYRDSSFDFVSAMDFLEHVEYPTLIVAEAARLLKPRGLFFFHTFNRNFLAWLIIIKGLEWFVKNTPKHMHILPLFIKPKEMKKYCLQNEMQVEEILGLRPDFQKKAFWEMLRTGIVPEDFTFKFTPSLLLSYIGVARKAASLIH